MHHCEAGTHLCWGSGSPGGAKCTAATGDEFEDYTCQCPEGSPELVTHYSHSISLRAEKFRHECEATQEPTKSPTKAPTKAPTKLGQNYFFGLPILDPEVDSSLARRYTGTADDGTEYSRTYRWRDHVISTHADHSPEMCNALCTETDACDAWQKCTDSDDCEGCYLLRGMGDPDYVQDSEHYAGLKVEEISM